jgi:hypothetical protein
MQTSVTHRIRRCFAGRPTVVRAASVVLVLGIAAGGVFATAPTARVAAPATPAAVVQDLAPAAQSSFRDASSEFSSPMAAPAADGSERPFDHRAHESVSCTACHGAGGQHRALNVRSPAQCAACHHDAQRAQACTDCHAAADLPEPGHVSRSVLFGVWTDPRMRELPFGHALHEQLDCQECHRTPVMLAADRECSACHESHHRPEAECTACHVLVEQPAHQAAVHLSCAGAGCHAPLVAPSPTLSRTLCLACHPAQRAHEPDGTCAACHLIPSIPQHRQEAAR